MSGYVQGCLDVCRGTWVCEGCLGMCRGAWVCAGVPAEFRRGCCFPWSQSWRHLQVPNSGLGSLGEQRAFLTMEPALSPSRPFSISSQPGTPHRALHQRPFIISAASECANTITAWKQFISLIFWVHPFSNKSFLFFILFFQEDLDYSLDCPPTHYISAPSFHALGS